MVAGPITGVAGIEHDPSLDCPNRCAIAGSEVEPSVIARPTAVLAEVGTDHGSRHWGYAGGVRSAAARSAAVAGIISAAAVGTSSAVTGRPIGLIAIAFIGLR